MATALAIIVGSLFFCLLMAVRISRQVSAPLAHIVESIGKLEDGHLDTRIHIEDGGEYQLLSSGVNSLASALQRAHVEHQQTLEQTTRDLQETLDELEVRNHELAIDRSRALETSRVKSEFLANVSHEIRTPLNGIMGFSDVLGRTPLTPHQQDFLHTIQRSSKDLMRIIDDILDISKITAGKLALEREPFTLRDVIDDVFTMLAPQAHSKQLELHHLLYSDVPVCLCGDALRLKQILTNLVNNAIKFTEHGHVTLQVSLISREQDRATLQFIVQDTGIGMDEQQTSRLFQAFSQADSSTARKFGGTGLGLIIARALVEAMHGDIQVHSEPGNGTTFTFSVDLELADEPFSEAFDRTPRVALYEPHNLSRMNLSNLLQQWQMAVIDIAQPSELTQWLTSPAHPVDAIIVSLEGDTSQYDFSHSKTPVIVLSHSFQASALESLEALGAYIALTNPFSHRKLKAALDAAIHGDIQEKSDDTPSQSLPVPRNVPVPTVLAVDDNDANLKLVITLLQELGVKAIAATSGHAAIEQCLQHTVDMVFMDIQMPGMNGLEASHAIRKLPGKARLPIIALTAHAMADEKEALLKAGLNDYQTKPISQQQLADSIQQWTRYSSAYQSAPAGDAQRADCVMDVATALQVTSNRPHLAEEMFDMLLDSLPKDRAAIVEQWELEDYDGLLAAVHRLHGATRYCGVPCLRQALDEFETALKGRIVHTFPQHMKHCMQQVDSLLHWADSNDWRAMLGVTPVAEPETLDK